MKGRCLNHLTNGPGVVPGGSPPKTMVAATGFEPVTLRVWTECSSQLSYAAISLSGRILPWEARISILQYIPFCQGKTENSAKNFYFSVCGFLFSKDLFQQELFLLWFYPFSRHDARCKERQKARKKAPPCRENSLQAFVRLCSYFRLLTAQNLKKLI